jgi:hypothetical protein
MGLTLHRWLLTSSGPSHRPGRMCPLVREALPTTPAVVDRHASIIEEQCTVTRSFHSGVLPTRPGIEWLGGTHARAPFPPASVGRRLGSGGDETCLDVGSQSLR